MGNFAQQVHPLVDEVELAIQRIDGDGEIEIFSVSLCLACLQYRNANSQ